MDHAQRVMAISGICRRSLRLTTVIANKPAIPNGTYVNKNQLYHYMSRYLLERISWLCRGLRPTVPEGDGRVKIIFARRGGMSTDDFKAYLRRLWDAGDPGIQIYWPVIDIDGIEAHDQSAKFGLQLADIAVSGMTWALEADHYGNCEPRFATGLKPVVYHRQGNYMSYGTKMFPTHDKIPLSAQQQPFIDLFGK